MPACHVIIILAYGMNHFILFFSLRAKRWGQNTLEGNIVSWKVTLLL